LPVRATTQPPWLTVVSARAALPLTCVPFRMSTGGRAADELALVLGAGDAVDGVTAGALTGGGATEADVTGEVTGGATDEASPGDEAAPGDETVPDGVEPDGVALGET
jgi:hypothetical protein